MINYYNSEERKFTFLHLEVRKLTTHDIIILSFFFSAILIHLIGSHFNYFKHIYGLLGIPFAIWYVTTTTPFGLRFRNIYFFFTWLILCLMFLFAGTSMSLVPISTFILYQSIRLVFWNKYAKEFIPYEVQRGRMEFSRRASRLNLERFVSKVEGRGGYKDDRRFMLWLFWLGLVTLMTCLFGLVGMRF